MERGIAFTGIVGAGRYASIHFKYLAKVRLIKKARGMSYFT
jgi:ornithine cyclodeaminase/alanine dehydrogenase-like protein (mu-crystallin family)